MQRNLLFLECEVKIAHKFNMKRHMTLVHNKINKISCVTCNAKFGQEDELKTHMVIVHKFTNYPLKDKIHCLDLSQYL